MIYGITAFAGFEAAAALGGGQGHAPVCARSDGSFWVSLPPLSSGSGGPPASRRWAGYSCQPMRKTSSYGTEFPERVDVGGPPYGPASKGMSGSG